MKPKKPSAEERGKALVRAGVAAGASAAARAGAAGAGVDPVTASIIGGVVNVVGGSVAKAISERHRRRAGDWFAEAVRRSGHTPEELRLLLEARAGEPFVNETIFAALRSLLDALDDAVAPAIGAITGEYLAAERQPDRFFRGFTRAVGDLDKAELAALKVLVRDVIAAAAREPEAERPRSVSIVAKRGRNLTVYRWPTEPSGHTDSGEGDPPFVELVSLPTEHDRRLLQLLLTSGLGEEPVSPFAGVAVTLDVSLLKRVDALLSG